MAREFFKNLPNTTTPLTAPRLNGLLDGDEPMGNVVVDSIRTKNMFDKSTIIAGDIINNDKTIRLSSRQALWLEAGTYTLSTNATSPFRYTIQVQNVGIPPLSNYPTYIYNSGWKSGSVSDTFTLSTSGYFTLVLSKENNATLTPSDVVGFNYQLEKGSSATSYSPYQNLDINEVILYSNSAGTQSSITLSDNWKNYSVIEVFYRNGWICSSSKIDVASTYNSVTLPIIYGSGTADITIHDAVVQFSGNTLSFMSDRWRQGVMNSSGTTVTSSQQIWITKIVGYK